MWEIVSPPNLQELIGFKRHVNLSTKYYLIWKKSLFNGAEETSTFRSCRYHYTNERGKQLILEDIFIMATLKKNKKKSF